MRKFIYCYINLMCELGFKVRRWIRGVEFFNLVYIVFLYKIIDIVVYVFGKMYFIVYKVERVLVVEVLELRGVGVVVLFRFFFVGRGF